MQRDLLAQAKQEMDALQRLCPAGAHIKTGDIRRLSGQLFRKMEDKSIAHVFEMCEAFLEQHTWALGVIAFDWAYRMKKQYTPDTYRTFYTWLKNYVRGWGDCDDFCTHAFGELVRQEKSLFSSVLAWTSDADFWVRRASAVVLIPAILRNDFEGIQPLLISDRLMNDEHELVLKGYGWMLKCLSQVEPSMVEEYLVRHHGQMPRVAYRYALEKLDDTTKRKLMAL